VLRGIGGLPTEYHPSAMRAPAIPESLRKYEPLLRQAWQERSQTSAGDPQAKSAAGSVG
jgi:hypothetical protein